MTSQASQTVRDTECVEHESGDSQWNNELQNVIKRRKGGWRIMRYMGLGNFEIQ